MKLTTEDGLHWETQKVPGEPGKFYLRYRRQGAKRRRWSYWLQRCGSVSEFGERAQFPSEQEAINTALRSVQIKSPG